MPETTETELPQFPVNCLRLNIETVNWSPDLKIETERTTTTVHKPVLIGDHSGPTPRWKIIDGMGRVRFNIHHNHRDLAKEIFDEFEVRLRSSAPIHGAWCQELDRIHQRFPALVVVGGTHAHSSETPTTQEAWQRVSEAQSVRRDVIRRSRPV